MPRPKQFSPDKLLETAMRIFWEKGYEATSIRDIVERSGVNQFGIYSLYGDKHGLFLAVLDKYRDDVVTAVLGVVEQPDASLPAIREYFGLLARYHSTDMRALGCLMTNSMAALAAEDADVHQRTKTHMERQRTAFVNALTRAKELGEVHSDLDIPRQADYLVLSVQGLAVYSHVNPDFDGLMQLVESILAPLLPLKK